MFDQGEGGLARPLVQENIPIALTDEVNLPRDVMKKKLLSTSLIGIHFRLFLSWTWIFPGLFVAAFPPYCFLCLSLPWDDRTGGSPLSFSSFPCFLCSCHPNFVCSVSADKLIFLLRSPRKKRNETSVLIKSSPRYAFS